MFRNFQFSMAGTQLEFVFSALFASLRFSWSSRLRSDHRLVCAFTLAAVLALSNALAAPLNGHLPVGKDGKPLYLDFEDGTLKDWTANQQVIFKSSGYNSENLRPVVADLREQQGKEIFIRLIDQEGGGWGHINFDNFRLYAERPKFANELDPAKLAQSDELPEVEAFKFSGLPPEQAAKEMTLPPGFKATLFAGEPEVKQPIAFAIDDRGRLWVAEAYTYPIRATEGEGKDRILIFEDTNGDGKFDKRTVFLE